MAKTTTKMGGFLRVRLDAALRARLEIQAAYENRGLSEYVRLKLGEIAPPPKRRPATSLKRRKRKA